MIQKEVKNTMVTNNTNASRDFSIDVDNSKAYQILADGIYRHKIAAIVRELMANCYDSHVSAGKTCKPFRIKRPTAINPVVEFEDFGLGMDDETINVVYTTFFTSTKTGSNDVIGALGLGSKTPLAYTQGFTVKSRKDGYERMYNIYKGNDGKPSFTLVHEGETEMSNGTTVSIPVKNSDFREFDRYIDFYSQFYTVHPDIGPQAPRQFNEVRSVMDRDAMYFTLPSSAMYGVPELYDEPALALMGAVPYPITVSEKTVGPTEYMIFEQLRQRGTMVFNFDIGDLDISASRESLSEDPETRDVLYHQVKQSMKIVRDNYERQYDQITTPKELLDFYQMDGISRNILIEKESQGLLSQKGVRGFSELKKFSETYPILRRINRKREFYKARIFANGGRITKYERYHNYQWLTNQSLVNGGKITFIEGDLKTKSGMIKTSHAYAESHPDEIVICLLNPLRECLKDTLRSDLYYADLKWINYSSIKGSTKSKETGSKADNQITSCALINGKNLGNSVITIDNPDHFRYIDREENSRDEVKINDTLSMEYSDLWAVVSTMVDPSLKLIYRNSTNKTRIKKLGIKPLAPEIEAIAASHDMSFGGDTADKLNSACYDAENAGYASGRDYKRIISKLNEGVAYEVPEIVEYVDEKRLREYDSSEAVKYIRILCCFHGNSLIYDLIDLYKDEADMILDTAHAKYPLLGLRAVERSDKIDYVSMINNQKGDSK